MAKPMRGEHERNIPWWPMGLSVALVAALLIGMLVLLPFYGRNEYQVGRYDAATGVSQVHYHGKLLAAKNGKLALPDRLMAAVGKTDEGYFVYVQGPAEFNGGGGGQPDLNAVTQGKQVYLRSGAGRYLPLTAQ